MNTNSVAHAYNNDMFLNDYNIAISIKEKLCYSDSVKAFEELACKYPNEELAYWVLGYIHFNAGFPDRSIFPFMTAINLNASCWPAWGGLGQAYSELEEWEHAEAAFRKRLELRESPNYYVLLCDVLNKKDQYHAALRCCHRAIELQPDHGEAYLNLGLTFRYLNRMDDSYNALMKSVEIEPSNSCALGEFAYCRFTKGEYDEAEKLLDKALSISRDDPDLNLYMGLVLEKKLNLKQAYNYFNNAKILSKDDFFTHQYDRFILEYKYIDFNY